MLWKLNKMNVRIYLIWASLAFSRWSHLAIWCRVHRREWKDIIHIYVKCMIYTKTILHNNNNNKWIDKENEKQHLLVQCLCVVTMQNSFSWNCWSSFHSLLVFVFSYVAVYWTHVATEGKQGNCFCPEGHWRLKNSTVLITITFPQRERGTNESTTQWPWERHR